MAEVLIPVFFVLAAGVLALPIVAIVLVIQWQKRRAEERRRALSAWAAGGGHTFSPKKQRGFGGKFPDIDALRTGSNRYASNVIHGTHRGRQLIVFDYYYETYTHSKHGRRTHPHHLTVVTLDSGLPLKPLYIGPESPLHRIAEVFGARDIDFESVEFSDAFRVHAADRRWAYDVIDTGMMEYLLQMPHYRVQLTRSWFCVYRHRHMSPEEVGTAANLADGMIDRIPQHVRRSLEPRPA